MKRLVPANSISQLWILLRRSRRLILKVRRKELNPYNITPGQANVLFIIHELEDEARFTEIAKYLNREVNTLSVQIKRMEKDGLLKRIREKPKSTLTRFELTEKGLELYEASRDGKSINDILMILSKEEQKQLKSILNKLAKGAEEKLKTI